MKKKVLIIGGVAGGATLAARLRRRSKDIQIIMFEKGDYISFANCGLPYYIGEVIKTRDNLLLQHPEAFKKKYNVDVRTLSEVIKINKEMKNITVINKLTGEQYEESYDELVIATGSTPLRPNIPGISSNNIFTIWNIPDTDAIKNYIEKFKPKTAAVIGGGFIGLEMVENLKEAGLSVNVIEMQDQVMVPLDRDMAELIHENMRMNNINLILEDKVIAFENRENKTIIKLESGKDVNADIVILSIGIKPNSKLALDALLKVNAKGGIIVDENLRTSDSSIYAVGDAIEVTNFIVGDKTMIPLAGPANKQARIAADNIAGDDKKYQGTMGTAIAKVFDYSVASVGINEKQLKGKGLEKNKDYYTVLINQKSHAGYYPGATPITLKMIFDEAGAILGAQIIGQDGVDKRIDTIATTMKLGGTIYDLEELELAYAPPFSSAKDPVNMLGFVADNVLSGLVSFVSWKEVDGLIEDKDTIILDVTEDAERMVFQITNSYHIPLGELHHRLNELDKNKLVIPYCAIGVRSYNAARVLMEHGFHNVKVLEGGTAFYKSMHNAPVEMKQEEKQTADISKNIKSIDCCGLQCPGPIMKINETMKELDENELLQVSATDMGFANDIDAWCKRTGNTLVKKERKGKENIITIKKGIEQCEAASLAENAVLPQGKTIIVFSGDLDKVLASFIIANGAAAMGRQVTMFFTFWGLNALRKTDKISVKKPFIEKMFGAMMPRGTKKLKLSKMNMGGMGTKMMKKVMKDKNVNSLEELMKKAMDSGIKLVACTMSMDVMGITKEELIDGVELAGVASYLGDAEESNVNLFV